MTLEEMERRTILRYGDKYEGMVPVGQDIGAGTFVCGSNKYSGEYKHAEFEGVGMLEFCDGDKYFGEYRGGMKDGIGAFLTASGDAYFGEFRRGFKEGMGVIQAATGERELTSWVGGKQTSSMPFDEANTEHAALLHGAIEAKARAPHSPIPRIAPMFIRCRQRPRRSSFGWRQRSRGIRSHITPRGQRPTRREPGPPGRQWVL